MNRLNEQQYKPVAAIMIYQLVDKRGYSHDLDPFYIEHHHISVIKGKPKLLQGQPLEKDHLMQVMAAFKESQRKTQATGFLPDRLLSFSEHAAGRFLLWWCPPGSQTLLFDLKGFKASGQGACPGLVFAVRDNKMNVFAVKGKRRPTPKSRLFHAPFYNMYERGEVCLGSAQLPKGPFETVAQEMKAYEHCFFNSVFSGHMENRKVLKSMRLSQLWRKQLKGKNAFPNDELVAHPNLRNMADLVSHIGG